MKKPTGFSICDRCSARWPSAPADVIHKCQCSGGMCYPELSDEGDILDEYMAMSDRYVEARDWSGAYCIMRLAYLEVKSRL